VLGSPGAWGQVDLKDFTLHERLAADCHVLGRFDLCWLLLHGNAALTWFILVPETDYEDLFDLPEPQLAQAMDEGGRVAAFAKSELAAEKLNYGAIGNLVPQMHLHVVLRYAGDTCWPAPVWGNLNDVADYSDGQLAEMAAVLSERYGLDSSARP
jgi:diadenosine tetraphosphate (Ap4A) HIT family hydrolase